MDLIHQDDLAVALAELVLGVHEDEPLVCGHLAAALVEGAGVFLQLGVVLGADDALRHYVRRADVLIVALGGFGGRSDDRLRELLVLDHALRKGRAAEAAFPCLVLAPGVSREVATDDHLDLERLAAQTGRGHRIDLGELPVRDDVGGGVQELGCYLIEHLSLVRDSLGEHDVEG